ncbi:hypothetical protein F3Y22_tig00013040pilonHSYRG00053 [Hibiscus syriacus]|uniref:RNase H type-1 domain-containing protein n=1 Tax=Hibiscus syriacus TaxID=106335 RepID=A0A6A3C2P6_HIBSY|nr:hypothetical protein F3Y22_tig00013040pilonHSYRG00053 [Hibiscus syriacus]
MRSITSETIWKRPPLGWLKVNSDGASHRESGISSCGVAIRNHEETDSLETIETLKRAETGENKTRLVEHIADLLKHDWVVRIQHVSRNGNKVADCMTKLTDRSNHDFIKFVEPLKVLHSMLHDDQLSRDTA